MSDMLWLVERTNHLATDKHLDYGRDRQEKCRSSDSRLSALNATFFYPSHPSCLLLESMRGRQAKAYRT